MPRYTHVSIHAEPIKVRTTVDDEQQRQDKPEGFWYEVDGDWRRWCQAESMGHWLEGRMLHRVVFGDESILRISSVDELDNFTHHYGFSRFSDRLVDGIEWRPLFEMYDGIEIAPYLWERRLSHASWYYSWDCASGVIWRAKGIRTEVIGPVPPANLGPHSRHEWPGAESSARPLPKP